MSPLTRHAIASVALLFSLTASAQTTAPAPDASTPVVRLEEFVATGSRFHDRTVAESPVPIDVIGGSELRQGGYFETSQQLQAQVPSFNFPRPSLVDGTDHIRPATLRGLAPDQTLVLINGKRRHTSALVNLNGTIGKGAVSTDFNAIPAGAIGRVEVLRDGASAQYGSDAIAGVINVILRKDTGWGLDLAWGQTKQGDGTDRKLDAYAGTKLGEKGSLFVTLWARDHGATDRSGLDTRQQYFGTNPATGAATSISGNYGSGTGASASNGTLDAREATFNRRNHRFGDPATKDKGLWFNGEHPLTDTSDLYFFGGASERHANAAGFYRRPGQDGNVRAIYPNGFLPFIESEVNDRSFSTGARGRGAAWNWDLSTAYGSNSIDLRTTNSLNVTLGAASPTSFYDGRLSFDQWTTNLDLTTERQLGLATPLKIALGAEHRWERYGIKAGEPASYRDGGVRILDGPSAGGQGALGAQVFPGFKPGDAGQHSRDANALYIDLEQNLSERVLVSLAGRFEDYSDFGRSTTGKLATRVKLTDTLALRGSVSTGFRAPHLAQEWFSSTATTFIGGAPYEILTFPVNNPAAVAFGASPLKAEKSVNESVGFTWTPAPSLTASIDYYHIDIKDRIVLSSNFLNNNGTNVTSFLAAQGITGIGGGRYFTNAVDTTTQGADLSVRYILKTNAAGKFTFTTGANVNRTRVTRIKTPPAALAAVTTTPLFDLAEQTRLEKGQPRDNLNLAVNWEVGKWAFLVREVRYGEISSVQANNATPAAIAVLTPGYDVSFAPAVPGTVGGTTTNQQVIQTFGAKWLTDLDLTYHATKHVTVSVGANNLFDVYPDKNIASRVVNGTATNGYDSAGLLPYTGLSPFGFNGAFYYAKLGLRF